MSTNYDFNDMTLTHIWEAVSFDQELSLQIAENMQEHGGSFVQALGKALALADHVNRYKIAEAFTDYILAYEPSKWIKEYQDHDDI